MDELGDIAAAVKALATQIAPGVGFDPKYGGEVMVPDPAQPKAFVGGVFIYKDHVSVEFSEGASLRDPGGHLEGKGKARRHVKLRTFGDIDGKDLAGFLRQALA
ncbi:DUF1801 domain-containing protein [Rhodobacteraceae bacterium N5(2021)]|uniref:DUF1801 domain-containing protein n=1 Tax=Gymnodinialimonas phycosphaerae TaxID=2841589 RepID=A0A975YFE2_9RHOB|nr:DUF1801 domain-containing protein [Gymnodinialimonas phycosphaerae]MBY4894654.1 DUF1801 domain-containing protein [Gymnodinialimonas phycosphaerae]